MRSVATVLLNHAKAKIETDNDKSTLAVQTQPLTLFN